jgi:tetratricopeptide (TPR) repeat protein
VKLHRDESEVLWPYIKPMVEATHRKFSAQFGINPTGAKEFAGKILLSMYPKHQDFSARTVGLPGLPALGACLGQVITMPSPRFGEQRPGGAFNWKRVFEHEYTHVLTLQLTEYRIPRWLTEGISTYIEEDPQIQYDRLLVSAQARGKLLPLEKLNSGFNRPTFPQQTVLCYYHSSLIVAHFVEKYGHDSLMRMMALYKEGKRDKEVLETVFGKPIEELDRECMAYVRKWTAQIKTTPPLEKEAFEMLVTRSAEGILDANAWTDLASNYLMRRKKDEAQAAARKALELDPGRARAYYVLGFIAYELDKDMRAAKEFFASAKSADPDYAFGRLYLGLVYKKEGDTKRAIEEFEAVKRIYPRLQEKGRSPHKHLAELYKEAGDRKSAIIVMQELTKINNMDYEAFTGLGELLAGEGRHAEAAAAYLEAFYINPFEQKTHVAAGKSYEKAKEFALAAREFRVASILSEYRALESMVAWARNAAAAGLDKDARRAIQSVRRIDPANAEAGKIEKSLKKSSGFKLPWQK